MKKKEPFIEPDFFSEYKIIRNQFRLYNPLQLIKTCINYLYSPTKTDDEQHLKHPWLVLLLIKWILIDPLYSTSNKKNLTQEKFSKILQMMYDFGPKLRMPNEYSHDILFLRNFAYQQFPYQSPFKPARFARQKILFDKVDDTHFFKQAFLAKTGLSITHFLELSFVLLYYYIENSNPNITLHWFNNLESYYSNIEIQNLLKIISIDINDLRKNLMESESNRRNSHEFYEPTPFLNFPLIKSEYEFICLYPNILYRALEH